VVPPIGRKKKQKSYVTCHDDYTTKCRPRFIMNTPEKLQQLQELRAKVLALEESLAATKRAELAQLPTRYGFDSAKDFAAAVLEAFGKRRGRMPRTIKAPAPAGKKRRTRAKITPQTRATVKKLVSAGKTGAEIAKAVGISLPSVQNIKKALGLVRSCSLIPRRNKSCGDVNHGQEGESVFFVAGGDPTKLLQFIKESFNAIPLFVLLLIVHDRFDAVGASGDDRLDAVQG